MSATASDPSGLDGICQEAMGLATTPYDYLIVGSGPGGGPLAARLALRGMKVLVLEAGADPGALPPGAQTTPGDRRAQENAHALYYCPGLHAASTEAQEYLSEQDPNNRPALTAWNFYARHFESEEQQARDLKAVDDPAHPGRKAVLYPRASALGGCPAHHAMISICSPDTDWQKMADFTGDDSWAPGEMRALYRRLERASYGVIGGAWARLWGAFVRWLTASDSAADQRGTTGWLDVCTTNPRLAVGDHQLLKVVATTVFDQEELGRPTRFLRWIKRALSGNLYRDLDLNDLDTMRTRPQGAALVPLAVSPGGLRRGPREHLLETRLRLAAEKEDEFSGCLHLATGIFVRRVIFEAGQEGGPPRAIGVEFSRGTHLYRASVPASPAPEKTERCYARREIILCGGAFNSPQLLMLSGIGDRAHLSDPGTGLAGMVDPAGQVLSPAFVHLPGVGRNLRDRCEIGIISERAQDFRSLEGVTFDPRATGEKQYAAWLAAGTGAPRTGLYTTNGAAIAILRRFEPPADVAAPAGHAHAAPPPSRADPPDIFLLGFPVAFRGYYPGWSNELLAPAIHSAERQRCLWTWAILKAYSRNTGSVRLRSANPLEPPEIQFCYFGESAVPPPPVDSFHIDEAHNDLAALKWAVEYVRRLNRQVPALMKDGDPDSAELQPGKALTNGSDALSDWIVSQAWGHHASGTCRIGRDCWQADPALLRDAGAVLDSHFRVHGVRGLRVVDASVFPEIPGYFLSVPIYIVSEKAADTILHELSF